jgi:hypothetical protein
VKEMAKLNKVAHITASAPLCSGNAAMIEDNDDMENENENVDHEIKIWTLVAISTETTRLEHALYLEMPVSMKRCRRQDIFAISTIFKTKDG